jgi:hypothetical protein
MMKTKAGVQSSTVVFGEYSHRLRHHVGSSVYPVPCKLLLPQGHGVQLDNQLRLMLNSENFHLSNLCCVHTNKPHTTLTDVG